MKTSSIEVHNLVKRYGEIEAVRGIDLEVQQGEIFGFLGPNGAGKSTTISILATLLKPTSGTASVAGLNVSKVFPLAASNHSPPISRRPGSRRKSCTG
jgi:ABC-2 type transport system ATP-binding protein